MNQEYWKYSRISRKELFRWCDYWQLPPTEARFLLTRGLTNKNEKKKFFSEAEEQFSPPFLWDDLEKGSLRIWKALQEGERICIYGDYDVDGISGTAILLEAIKRLGHSAEYYIPNRQEEGYGLNKEALDTIIDSGINVLITVDCGTTSVDLIQEAQKKMDVIVTDHHLPGIELPKGYALINPQCVGNFSPDPLSGAGVAFKLAQGIYFSADKPVSQIQDLLGWAALATVTDMVPLQGENRLTVKKGLAELRKSSHVGLKALMDVAGINQQELNEKDLGFSLGPRLNASGRLQTARLGVELFLCSDPIRAQEIAIELNEINRERQQVEKEILEEACKMVEKYSELPSGIVLYQPNWHPGVIGIVASRIARLYWRPTLLLCGSEEIKGSGRSIPAVDLYETLVSCSHYLTHFGGHRQAAGLSLAHENLDSFYSAFQEVVKNQATEEDLVRQRSFDGMLTLDEINNSLEERLGRLAPFGIGNQAPRFVFPYLEVISSKAFGKDRKHLKFEIRSGEQTREAIILNRGSEFSSFTPGMIISGIGEFRKNTWNQIEKFDLFLEEVSIGEEQPLLAESFSEMNPPEISNLLLPTQREVFKKFFELLAQVSKKAPVLSSEQIGLLWKEIRAEASWQEVDYLLRVFEEIGIITSYDEYLISIINTAQKTSLEKSQSYKEELEKARE